MIKLNKYKINLTNEKYELIAERQKGGIQITFDFGWCLHGINATSVAAIAPAVTHLTNKLINGVKYHTIDKTTASNMIADATLAGSLI